MDETTIDTAELFSRLLAVMPACWLEIFVRSLEHIDQSTGYGRSEVEIYRHHIVQINQVTKNKI